MHSASLVRWSIAAMLLVLAYLKYALLARGPGPILDQLDPLLGLPNRYLVQIAAPWEMLLGLFWLFPQLTLLAARLTLATASAFLIHYFASGAFLEGAICPCLGTMGEWVPWLKSQQRFLTLTIAAWLLLVSYLYDHHYGPYREELVSERVRKIGVKAEGGA